MPAESFNIDHVVILRQGAFAVETEGFAKPKRDQGPSDAKVEFDSKSLKFPDLGDEQAPWSRRRGRPNGSGSG